MNTMIHKMNKLGFVERIHEMSRHIGAHRPNVQTEEAAKTALVLPFLAHVLGWDQYNPTELHPEYTADVGIKKGEKVDYALMRDGAPVILIEAKKAGAPLVEAMSQLFRYFSTTDARIGIITDGVKYWFFSDLDRPDRMDEKPFMEIDLADPATVDAESLEMFTRDRFDTHQAVDTARDLRYAADVRAVIDREFKSPSEGFLRYLATEVGVPRVTKSALSKLKTAFLKALHQFASHHMRTMHDEPPAYEVPQRAEAATPAQEPADDNSGNGTRAAPRKIARAVVGDRVFEQPKMVAVRDELLFRAIRDLGRSEVEALPHMPRISDRKDHKSSSGFAFKPELNVSIGSMSVRSCLRCLETLSDRMNVPVRVEFVDGEIVEYGEATAGA